MAHVWIRSLKVEKYEDKTDEEVAAEAKNGNDIALEYLIKIQKLCKQSPVLFLIGADREDIIQEGMIGLYKAIRDFKGDKLSSFRALQNSV